MIPTPGTVTQVSPLLVLTDSADTATPALCLAHYSPKLNDRVSLLRQGSQILVLGNFQGGDALAVSAVRASSSSTISSSTHMGILSTPAVMGDGIKKFKITIYWYSFKATVTGDNFEAGIRRDGATLLDKALVSIQSTYSGPYGNGGSLVTEDVPAAGSHTYDLTAARRNGTGTAFIEGGTGYQMGIIAEQMP
jgi:hypothetical protein